MVRDEVAKVVEKLNPGRRPRPVPLSRSTSEIVVQGGSGRRRDEKKYGRHPSVIRHRSSTSSSGSTSEEGIFSGSDPPSRPNPFRRHSYTTSPARSQPLGTPLFRASSGSVTPTRRARTSLSRSGSRASKRPRLSASPDPPQTA